MRTKDSRRAQRAECTLTEAQSPSTLAFLGDKGRCHRESKGGGQRGSISQMKVCAYGWGPEFRDQRARIVMQKEDALNTGEDSLLDKDTAPCRTHRPNIDFEDKRDAEQIKQKLP